MLLKIKELLGVVLSFTTGLGFYGLGLLALGGLALFFDFNFVGAGLVGAFVFKNYETAVTLIKEKVLSKEEEG